MSKEECQCYENGKCLWTKRYYENNIVPDCEKVKNCYFKQLQQLKQTIAQIQKILEVYFDDDWKATREIEKIIKEVNNDRN